MRYAHGFVVVSLLAPVLASAQIPVTDVGNLTVNTTSAIQSTIAAVQTTLTVANQIVDLTPVTEIVAAQGIAQDMAMLGDVLLEAKLLYYDLESLNRQIHVLFALESAPAKATDLALRLAEIRLVAYQSRTFAARTQTLITTLWNAVGHMIKLVEGIEVIVGSLQGQQRLMEVQSTVAKTLAVMEIQQAALARAETIDKLTEGITMESIRLINEDIRADWPKE